MGVYSELEAEFDIDIVDEFLSHYTIMMDVIDNLIIGLKYEESFKENIEQIFRIMHNIKSATGYLKITPINKVVTLTEEILEDCRELSGKGSEELIDWLLLVSDMLKNYKDNLSDNSDSFDKINHNIIKIPKLLIIESTKV
jgi:two-component system chemotaxis sensor kinase CheA